MTTEKEIVIDIDPQGMARAMHFDKFPLGYLGKMEVRRASEITFNAATQRWDIEYYHEDGSKTVVLVHPGFCGYDEARNHEVAFVQQCRKDGVRFDSSMANSG